jgi:hypothetical protein
MVASSPHRPTAPHAADNLILLFSCEPVAARVKKSPDGGIGAFGIGQEKGHYQLLQTMRGGGNKSERLEVTRAKSASAELRCREKALQRRTTVLLDGRLLYQFALITIIRCLDDRADFLKVVELRVSGNLQCSRGLP